MRRTLQVADRLVVGVAGLILVAGGVLALLWWQNVDVVVDAVSDVDNSQIRSAPEQSWWGPALLAATIVLAIVGLWLLLGNVRTNRVRTVSVGNSTDLVGGIREVSVPDLGKAAAKSLERHRQIRSTHTRTYTEGTTPILEITVTFDPAAEGHDVIDLLRAIRHQLQCSLAGSQVQVQMLLHRAPND